MSERLHAEFAISGWDESPIDPGTGVAKLTEALVEKTYSGDIEGTSVTKWLMAYAPDKTAAFIGLERIRGSFAGRHGSLVLQHLGTFEGHNCQGCFDGDFGDERAQDRFRQRQVSRRPIRFGHAHTRIFLELG